MEKERKTSQVCGALEDTQVDEAAEKAGDFLSIVFEFACAVAARSDLGRKQTFRSLKITTVSIMLKLYVSRAVARAPSGWGRAMCKKFTRIDQLSTLIPSHMDN